MTLLTPVDLVAPAELAPLHFIAVGGAGMSGVASLYHELGFTVSGCDQSDTEALAEVRACGIPVHVGHAVAHLDQVATVVVSSAVRASNPELAAARDRHLRIWHRSAALGALMLGRTGVAVAGTHGKTTTSAMICTLLAGAGRDPAGVIGAPLAATGRSFWSGSGDAFVVEADESDGSFLQYPAQVAVVTNVEADHLDNWGTAAHYAQGFRDFASATHVRCAVINVDDPGARALYVALQAAPGNAQLISYGTSADADYRFEATAPGLALGPTPTPAQRVTPPAARLAAALPAQGGVIVDRTGEHPFQLQVPGQHNLANATAAFAVGRYFGIPAAQLASGLATFSGTLRRFQPLGSAGGVRVFDDYAHHPTEIRATLAAARSVSHGRLIACFQPHLYSRTRDFAAEFGAALGQADIVVLTDVYPAREDPIVGVSGALIAAEIPNSTQVHYVPDKTQLAGTLARLAQPGDLVLTLGAGDITVVGPELIRMLQD